MNSGVEITDLGIGLGSLLVQSYGSGGFVIGGERYEGSVMIYGGEVFSWDCLRFGDIREDDFVGLLGADIDLCFLGCGGVMSIPNIDVRDCFEGRGVALDFMGTGAACRSYNVAVGEGREVGGAFIAV